MILVKTVVPEYPFPSAVAFDAAGGLLVGSVGGMGWVEGFSSNQGGITKFRKQGDEWTRDWNQRHYEKNNSIAGLVEGSDTHIYATIRGQKKTDIREIHRYDASGKFIEAFGESGRGDGQFCAPNGIALDTAGNIFVVESNANGVGANNRIQKLDSNGKFLLAWGKMGTADSELNLPCGIAATPNGEIFVADTYNCRIQKFDSNGKFLFKWGCYGFGPGEFNCPHGIALDSQGAIFVADTHNNRIQKFDPNGKFLAKWGRRRRNKDDAEGFLLPTGVAVNADGQIAVADLLNHCVKIISL